MPKVGDKVWYRNKGMNMKADVVRVDSDVQVDLNVFEESPYEDGGASIAFGIEDAQRTSSDAEKSTDGKWWPRNGRFVHDPRKRWEGE